MPGSLSPKIISFYWCSKLTHGGVSGAKLKPSYREARGFLLSGKRFLSVRTLLFPSSERG